jgi:ribosomal protein S18 acetylase RimI-like enzyme
MQAAEDEAREQGCARLDLSTARTNLPAQALYQSRGWQRDEIYLHFSRQVAPGS